MTSSKWDCVSVLCVVFCSHITYRAVFCDCLKAFSCDWLFNSVAVRTLSDCVLMFCCWYDWTLQLYKYSCLLTVSWTRFDLSLTGLSTMLVTWNWFTMLNSYTSYGLTQLALVTWNWLTMLKLYTSYGLTVSSGNIELIDCAQLLHQLWFDLVILLSYS